MTKPIARKDLNTNQKDILLILYKFRYATVDLIATYQGLRSSTYTHTRLKILREQKYIGRHFTPQDKIDRKPAIFFLLPKGIAVLKAKPELNQKFIPNMYKDRGGGEAFMKRCLGVFRLNNKLRELYEDDLTFYSKTETSEYNFFPKVLPEAFLLIKETGYLLDILPALTTYPALRGSIDRSINHFKAKKWTDDWEDYPTVLLVCETPYLERLARRVTLGAIYKAQNNDEEEDGTDMDSLTFLTTTTKALFGSESSQHAIWTNAEEPDELVSL